MGIKTKTDKNKTKTAKKKTEKEKESTRELRKKNYYNMHTIRARDILLMLFSFFICFNFVCNTLL